MNRLKRIAVTPDVLLELMKHGVNRGVRVVANPLPHDATFEYATFDPERLCLWLVIHSQEFPELCGCEVIPEFPQTLFEDVY